MNISSTREPSIDPKLSTNQTDTKGRIQTDKSRDFERREKSIKMKRQTRLSRQRFPLHHRWPKSLDRMVKFATPAREREKERHPSLLTISLFAVLRINHRSINLCQDSEEVGTTVKFRPAVCSSGIFRVLLGRGFEANGRKGLVSGERGWRLRCRGALLMPRLSLCRHCADRK